MKILRKNDNFKKMPDSNINDVVSIKALIDYGWKYCSKREYKDFFKKQKENDISNDDIINDSKNIEKKEKRKKK